MKAHELRIGNWVYLKSKNKWYQITSGYEIDIGTDSDDMEPIILDDHWLRRLGFDNTNANCWVYGKFKFIELKYVHQLQNLYATLTGEELIITK